MKKIIIAAVLAASFSYALADIPMLTKSQYMGEMSQIDAMTCLANIADVGAKKESKSDNDDVRMSIALQTMGFAFVTNQSVCRAADSLAKKAYNVKLNAEKPANKRTYNLMYDLKKFIQTADY